LECSFTVGDVSDSSFFSEVATQAGEEVSAVAYAVGTINLKGLGRLTSEDFLQDYHVNVVGAALAVQASIGVLKKNKGSILFFSSVAAQLGLPMHASIGAAKGAINGLTVSLAAELSPAVRVNAIAPSLCETPLGSKVLLNDKMKEGLASMHALKRLGQAEDVASLAQFVLSDEASWMTGQVIGVDGGRGSVASS
jgi:NAD(P)-dependent dehydrogenase (short-subunit alcohol dehydrogenase family)